MSVADAASATFIPAEVCRDFSKSSTLEWLETNHTGAFAMGTVAGVNTRRYHGLLIAALHPPVGRVSIFSRVEETVSAAGQEFALATAQYPGAVSPHGFDLLEDFRIDPFPTWGYDIAGTIIKKTLCLLDRRQAVLLWYRASQPSTVTVRLFLSFRDYHSLAHQNPALAPEVRSERGRCSFTPYAGLPALTILHSGETFHPDPLWYSQNEYLRELDRGLDFREDLYSPGLIVLPLQPNRRAWLLASIEADQYEHPLDDAAIESLVSSESKRRIFPSPFARALDQFRITRENGQSSLIAGYPWFTDWSRDTLLSLPALARCGFPAAETKAVLSMLLAQRNQGMLPNRFTDSPDTLEYNTVDGTLAFFTAAHDYLEQSGDSEFLASTLYPAALDILDWHNRGTAFHIKNDPSDQLLYAGEPGWQLTWMDAKVGERVVTPRIGKPVEINALWYNALRITAGWAGQLGRASDAAQFHAQADATHHSFKQKFWNESLGCLYDVVTDAENDASLRPNQLFSIALPFPLLDAGRAQSVIGVIRDKLLTPMGLRTLAPDDPAYKPRFEGDMAARDSAYHQGTVWPWLIGPYIAGYLFAFGRTAASLSYCDELLKGLETQLEACCLGSISEVYDGSTPQHPGGCPAQLWSVAQVVLARALLAAH